MLRCTCVVAALAVLAGRAAADDVFTLELSGGPGYLFDSPTTAPLPGPRTQVAHQRTATFAGALGIGGFVAPRIALLGRLSCEAQAVCFAGPSVQIWPNDQVWFGAGAGFGSDPDCLGAQKSCGVDTCSCNAASDAFELRGGASLTAFRGWSVQFEYLQYGVFSAKGYVNIMSLQLGYQWH